MPSKKITDLTTTTAYTGDDLFIVVDQAGPTTMKMTAANLFANVPANTVFSQNVAMSAQLTLTGNTTSTKHIVSNNFIVTKNNTPASSTTGVAAAEVGMMWADGDYLYVQANTTAYKRVALATF